MIPHLKILTGTLQLNTTQLSASYFCVTRTVGNQVYACQNSFFHFPTFVFSKLEIKFNMAGKNSRILKHMRKIRPVL